MFNKSMTAAAAVLAVVGTAAFAQVTEWKTVGDWNINVDASSGNGCLMSKQYDNGIMLQFGLLPLRNGGFFAAYNKDWTFIEKGKDAPVTFLFEGIRFDGKSQGYVSGPWYGGFVFTNNPALVYEFAKKKQMTVTAGDNPPVTLSLDGTLKATDELIACQEAQG